MAEDTSVGEAFSAKVATEVNKASAELASADRIIPVDSDFAGEIALIEYAPVGAKLSVEKGKSVDAVSVNKLSSIEEVSLTGAAPIDGTSVDKEL